MEKGPTRGPFVLCRARVQRAPQAKFSGQVRRRLSRGTGALRVVNYAADDASISAKEEASSDIRSSCKRRADPGDSRAGTKVTRPFRDPPRRISSGATLKELANNYNIDLGRFIFGIASEPPDVQYAPRDRTSSAGHGTPEKCQPQTQAPQQTTSAIDGSILDATGSVAAGAA
jgi:hypothetical protein